GIRDRNVTGVQTCALPICAIEQSLRKKLEDGYGARIAAGYSWPWGEPQTDGTLPADVVIGDWAKPWNNKKDTTHGDAPGTAFWEIGRASCRERGWHRVWEK